METDQGRKPLLQATGGDLGVESGGDVDEAFAAGGEAERLQVLTQHVPAPVGTLPSISPATADPMRVPLHNSLLLLALTHGRACRNKW